MTSTVKAEIEQEKTPRGKPKPGHFDVFLSNIGGGDLRYLRLSAEELDAIAEAWAIERVRPGVLL